MLPYPLWFTYLVVGLFGACVGSFLNVCIYRLPLGRSIVKPRSQCPRCRKQIHWYDNIPLFSYVFLQGKCRHCGGRIPPRYILVELITVGLSVATFAHFGKLPEYLIYFCFLVAPLIVVTFIDLEHKLIPDVISLPGVAAGAMARLAFNTGPSLTPVLIDIILGVLVGGGFLCIVGLGYEWLKEAGGNVEWLSFDHPVHGYVFIYNQKDRSFKPDAVQQQAYDAFMAYFDKHLKHAHAATGPSEAR